MQREVEDWADRYNCAAHRAFPAWALNFIFDLSDDDAYNQSETLSQGDAGLDGYFYDMQAGIFHLLQAKYPENPRDAVIKPGDVDPLIRAALLLGNPESLADGPHAEKLGPIAHELEQARLDGADISLDLIIAGGMTKESFEQFRQAAKELGCSAELYDLERLSALSAEDGEIGDLAGTTVSFKLAGPNEFYERPAIDLEGVGKSAVTALDGLSVGEAVNSHGPGIFRANVRYFLKKTNKVNRRMAETLSSRAGRDSFWIYNNGLTIVADDFSFEPDESGSWQLVTTNPQIVNGAQTSTVLSNNAAAIESGEVAVQARIVKIYDDEAGKAALEKISEFTNSQSAVSSGDLRANDDRHVQIQTSFKQLPEKYFYERRRGEWSSLSVATQRQYNKRMVTKDKIGQRYLAYVGKPASAVGKKDVIYAEMAEDAFDPETHPYVYLLAYELWDQAAQLLKKSNRSKLYELVPNLENRLNETTEASAADELSQANTLVCAHATAMARYLLNKRYKEIGKTEAEQLRRLVSQDDSKVAANIWKWVFSAIWNWQRSRKDTTSLKTALQRDATVDDLYQELDTLLVLMDRSLEETFPELQEREAGRSLGS